MSVSRLHRASQRYASQSQKRGSAASTGGLASSIANAFTGTMSKFISELKGFHRLEKADKVEILLESWSPVDAAVHRFGLRNKCDFDPVTFLVQERTAEGARQLLYTAKILSERRGISLCGREDGELKELMFLALPTIGQPRLTGETRLVGRVLHPSGVCLYKMGRTEEKSSGSSFVVQKATGENMGMAVMRVEERLAIPLYCTQCCGLVFDAHEFIFYRGDVVIGKLRPMLEPRWNNYALDIAPHCLNLCRPLMLAFALLQTLQNGYTELFNIMAEGSVREGAREDARKASAGIYGTL